MKKLLLFALLALMMAGCSTTVEDDTEKCKGSYHTIILDSCEYISHERVWDITHKGNCRFCKERRQKELEELVIKFKKK